MGVLFKDWCSTTCLPATEGKYLLHVSIVQNWATNLFDERSVHYRGLSVVKLLANFIPSRFVFSGEVAQILYNFHS